MFLSLSRPLKCPSPAQPSLVACLRSLLSAPLPAFPEFLPPNIPALQTAQFGPKDWKFSTLALDMGSISAASIPVGLLVP